MIDALLLRRFLSLVDGRLTWITLSRMRNSFVSKATTAISLSALVLSKSGHILGIFHVETAMLVLTMWGGLLFVAGFILFGIKAPLEFRHPGEIFEIVGRMVSLTTPNFLASRVMFARKLVERLEAKSDTPSGTGSPRIDAVLNGRIAALKDVIGDSTQSNMGEDEKRSAAIELYQADLEVRQFDNVKARRLVGGLMFVGVLFLLVPTLGNVLSAIWL